MSVTYYAEEISAVPFGTMAKALSQQVGPLAYPIAAFFAFRGLIRWPLKPTYGVSGLGTEREVPREALPPRANARLAGIFETLHDLGFQPLKHAIANTIGEKEHCASLFIDGEGGTLMTVEWMRLRGADGPEEATSVEMNSYFGEDPDVMTGWMKQDHILLAEMMTLSFVELHCIPNTQPLGQAYERHLQRTRVRNDPFHMTPEAALEEHKRRTQRRFDWALERGLLRPMTNKEVARVKQLRLP